MSIREVDKESPMWLLNNELIRMGYGRHTFRKRIIDGEIYIRINDFNIVTKNDWDKIQNFAMAHGFFIE